MRNLKKLLAVIAVVAMLATLMVPALAAEGFKYEAEAQKLYDLGLFKGNSDTSYVPDLGATLNRQAGLALAIRLMGKDAEVAAMTAEEVATQLAKIVDADTITDWAKPYAAYAVKNGLTNGIDASILPNVKFGAQLDLTGKEFVNFVLKAMGYQVAWDDVLTKAAGVGMLSAGDAVTFGTTAVLTRDGAVGVMANALGGTTSGGVTLAQALVDAGAVTAEAMAAAGFFTPTVAPTAAPAVLTATASGDNLLQIKVVYSQEVDKDSAEDKDNYEIEDVDIDSAKLQDDGVTVVLTLAYADAQKQQAKVDLTIDGVKDTAGTEMDETTIEDVELFDKDIPTAVEASIVGNDTFKVIFSEPMKGTKNGDVYKLDKDDFVVNGGKTYVKEVRLQNNYTEALVEMYSNFKEGDITLQIKSGSEDFAGFGVIGKTFDLEVVPDKEAPVVIGYENAKLSEVTLIWSEDIEFSKNFNFVASADDRENFYHTNSKNPVRVQVNKADGTIDKYSVKLDGNKMTLYFDSDTELPEGTAYVYVAKEAIKDLWDNKNAQQMTQVEVELDVTAPEVDGDVDVKDENKIEIKFTEELDEDSAEKEANYTLLDKDGKEVDDMIDNATYASKKVTIDFEEDLNGDYSIVIENVEDVAGNEIAATTVDFTVGDKTAPDTEDFKAVVYDAGQKDQMIKVDFDDVMATDGNYAVDDVSKYVINRGNTKYPLEKIDDVEIVVVDDGKAVEIYVPSEEDIDKDNPTVGKDYLDLDPKDPNAVPADVVFDTITIARVADAADNKISELTVTKDLVASDTIDVDKVEATAPDTVEVTFKDSLADFEEEDFVLSDRNDADEDYQYTITGVETKENSDGNTVAVFTVDDDLDYDLETPVWLIVVPTVDSDDNNTNDETESANRYGKTITLGGTQAADKIKAELYDNGDDDSADDYAKDGDYHVKDYLRIDLVETSAAQQAEWSTVAGDVYGLYATLYFSEEIALFDDDMSLAGYDFNITLNNSKLYNGTDYKVVGYGETAANSGIGFVQIRFKGKDVKENNVVIARELKGDLEIDLVDTLKYVQDTHGNTLKDFDAIEVDNVNLKANR